MPLRALPPTYAWGYARAGKKKETALLPEENARQRALQARRGRARPSGGPVLARGRGNMRKAESIRGGNFRGDGRKGANDGLDGEIGSGLQGAEAFLPLCTNVQGGEEGFGPPRFARRPS